MSVPFNGGLVFNIHEQPHLLIIRNLANGNRLEWIHGMPAASGMLYNSEEAIVQRHIVAGVQVHGNKITVGPIEGMCSENERGHRLSIQASWEDKETELSLFSEEP